ncbi:MAG TPA: hypothetical protein VGC54_02655, partial [Planctomycetota bacterium]
MRGLLGGWAMIGLPPGQDALVRSRLEEDRLLLGRIDWIRGVLHAGAREELLGRGEAPQVLLAAALGLDTPEELGAQLPAIGDPEAALALAVWLEEAVGGRGEDDRRPLVKITFEATGMVLRVPEAAAARTAITPLRTWLLEGPAGGVLRFRPAAFRRANG